MKTVYYLYKMAFINRLKKALRKPVTYIYAVIIVAYAGFMLWSFGMAIPDMGIGTPKGMVMILSFICLTLLPGNFAAYAKRKGLIFKNSDVHFLFTAPVNPKIVLLYAQIRTLFIGLLISLCFLPLGVIWFHVPIWKMIVYFLVSTVVENVFETSIMLLLYGNERFSEKVIKMFCNLIYLFLGALVLYGVYLFFKVNDGFAFIGIFLQSSGLQMIPIIGWMIAFYRLLFLGPTVVNVAGTVLFLLSALVFFVLALKMRCTGEYYENAMKFADDYAEARKKQKKGEISLVGKKQKFGKAKITYKGKYGKSIFYRQLLEYKKNRFFIFSFQSLLCLGVGIAVVFLCRQESEIKPYIRLILPGVSAYVTFIFSGYITKWAKELDNPYTFLIPDSPLRKLWYSTLIEHIRAFVDGLFITLPAAIYFQLNISVVILNILIFMCLQANKLYLHILAEALLGNLLGTTGKQIFRMLAQAFCISLGIGGAVLGTLIVNENIGYICMILSTAAITLATAIWGATVFGRMERIDA